MWLVLLVLAVTLAFVLTPGPSRVALLGWEIPEFCFWKRTFGVACPGCGLTRSWTYLAHGDIVTSLWMNAAGPVAFLFAVLQIPLTVRRLWLRVRRSHAPRDP